MNGQLNNGVTAVLIASAILAFKMWLSGTITTYVRGRAMESPNREDGAVMNFFNRVFFVPTQPLTVLPHNAERDEAVNRWLRITSNDAANIPITLLLLYQVAATDALPQSVVVSVTAVFVAARLAHTVFYALAIQPLRTVAYSAGATCMFIAAAGLLRFGFAT